MSRRMLAGAVVLSALVPASVEAKGCLKGAAVGGVAGHFVGRGHAKAGAVVGCLGGHHMAKRRGAKHR